MKRFLTILSLVILGFASTSCYDDSALWESVNELDQRVKTLETLCTEMNTNLTSLQTLVNSMKQGDYIVDVAPLTEGDVEVGYKITFNERGTINIYHGKDGASFGDVPEFGVKQDTDGVYYWTVNGEWVLDDKGNKLPVSASAGAAGVTPKLKVENEKWYVSYDEGKTWEEVGSAVTAGAGSCIFKDVKLTEDALTLTMADGNVIVVPIGEKFRIVLGEFDAESIQYGKEVVVPYTIEGAKGEVSVFVLSDGWMFETELKEETALSGKVTIWQDDYYDEEIAGKVAIFAVAEDGTAVSKVIRLLSGVLYPSSDNYNDTYTVSAEAGQLEFTVSTNREVEVSTGADWITYADTKAVEEKTLVFDIQENDGARRKTYVEIASGDIDFGFTVAQKGFSDGFSLEYSCNVLGGGWQISVDTLYNKAGQKIHEVLGYSSWEEVAAAAGDYDALINRTGEVKLLSYDLYTGEALPYDEQYRIGYGFKHDEEGYLVENGSYYKSGWNWFTLWDGSSEYLNNEFYVYTGNIYAGESLSFGILLTSPTGEARIEVTINVTEYVDPEAGLYDNPASPGTYEFVISDTLDVDNQLSYPSSQNLEIAELIKSTLGMTTYEIYQAIEWGGFDREYVFADGSGEYGNYTISLDKYGNNAYWYYDSMIAGINWFLGATSMYMEHWFSYEGYDNGRYIFAPAVYDAVGSTAKYDYIIRYNDYKLIFTHEISIVGEKPSKNWYLVGDFNGWTAGDAAYQMVDEGDWYVYYGFTTTGNELKFNAGDWSDNRGGDFLAQNVAVTLWQDGSNILVPEGKYDIYMNKEATEAYFMTPGLKPGEKPYEPVEPGVIWENDGTVGAAYWSSFPYRFSIEGGDANNECCAEIPADIWADMKVAPFSVEVQPAADWWQIRILSGWWSNQWPKEGPGGEYDIFATTEGVVANEDGTYTFEVDLRGHSLADAMDQEHILFAGEGFIINKIYFATGEEEFVQDYRWTKNPTADLWEGYDASQKVKLAKYGDYVLVANGKKIGAINPKTGVVENVYDSPIEINSFCTDDAGNILIANDGAVGEDINVYVLSDINGTPELLATYNTGNYYALETGNLRVKGNVKGDAVITMSASDGAGGAVIYWEITGGECSPWYWTSVPYTAWSVTSLCCAPAGSTLSDGFFYIGYGGDYNLKYAGNVVKDGTTDWVTSYVTGSTWMENYNSISTAEYNGNKYAAVLKSCHFEYDSADVVVLNVDDPASASEYYVHYGDYDVSRDEGYMDLNWTGLGTFSDVLLMETGGELLAIYIDSNYGALACTPCYSQKLQE